MPDTSFKFLNYISSLWDQSIPLKVLWTIEFTSLPNVVANVGAILDGTERTNSSIRKFPTNPWISQTLVGGTTIPTLLAQKISFPTDSFTVNYTDNNNTGGLYGGYFASQRENYTQVSIDFLETNKDIIDFIARPWLIAASYKGLIEDGVFGEPQIKTDLIATLYSKFDQVNWGVRKQINFEGVVPTMVAGDNLSYASETNSSIVKPVQFTFKRYYITDPNV